MIPCQDKDLSECRHHARPDFQPRYVYPMSMKATGAKFLDVQVMDFLRVF
jgi:hypothetical protein